MTSELENDVIQFNTDSELTSPGPRQFPGWKQAVGRKQQQRQQEQGKRMRSSFYLLFLIYDIIITAYRSSVQRKHTLHLYHISAWWTKRKEYDPLRKVRVIVMPWSSVIRTYVKAYYGIHYRYFEKQI